MELKENAVYDLVCVSSMGVRITPVDRQPVHTSYLYEMQATSAETNVLNISAALGRQTLVMTRFVADSPIAAFIRGELRKRGIEYTGPEVPAGGPWGYRHQFNIADAGYGMRGPIVTNDRAGEVGRTICPEDFDLERIFARDGARLLHISGLIAAMSEQTARTCLAVARKAKACGTRISFDLNYRASFWKGREEELSAVFREIAGLADILIGNEEDYQLALGISGPEAGGRAIGGDLDGYRAMVETASKVYPNVRMFAATLRQVVSANEHLWGSILLAGGRWYEEPLRPIPVLDRIGGGDGFVGGLLYGVLKGWEPETCMQFGWASGALVTTMTTDYGTPAGEDQVWSVYRGNARVKR